MQILKNKNAMGGYCSIAMDSLNTILFVDKTLKTHFNVLKRI